MADLNFVVKNGLVVNGAFTANSTVVNAAAITATSANIASLFTGGVSVNTMITGNAATAFANAVSNAAGIYQTMAGLSANVAALTSNSTSFVGSVSAANVVSNAQLQANLTNYQTTAGLSANVATLTSNNSSFFAGQNSSFYTDIPSRLGYTPANKAGDTFTGQVRATQFLTDTNQPYYMRADGAVSMSWNGSYIVLNQPISTYAIYDLNDANFFLDMNGTSRLNVVTAVSTVGANLFERSGNAPRLRADAGGNYVYLRWDSNDLYYNISDVVDRRIIYSASNIKRIDVNYDGPARIDFLQTDNNIVYTFVDGFSDVRLKDNIANTSVNSLSLIKQVELKQFDWNEEGMTLQRKKESDKHVRIGLIAQEVEQLFPEAVGDITTNAAEEGEESTSRKSIKYDALVPYLIGAIQQQQKQIDELKQLLAAK